MSTNVDDYTTDELMSIIGIDTLTEENVENACGEFIQRFQGSSNEEIVTFFQNIEGKLLDQIELDNENELENENENDNQDASNPVSSSGNANDWFGSTYLQQGNKQQKDKITQRENKVQLFDNGHVPMNREQLGVTNNYQVKVGQDTLNPVLQNTISRYIVIDSQYRQSSSGDGYTLNTDFTLDLSEHMVNVLSIRLSAIQIPFSWFNINSSRSYFYIYNKEDDGSGVYQDEYYLIKIEEGNYDTIDAI
jgi:Flp pilus assembly protein TadG